MRTSLGVRRLLPRFWIVAMCGLLAARCGSDGGGASDGSPNLKSGPIEDVATTAPGYKPENEMATATEIRDRLIDDGIDCTGEAAPPPPADDPGMETGVVAGLDCTVDGADISIGVYQSEDAKRAGLERLAMFSCMMPIEHREYVDGGTWVVGALVTGQNESDVAMTARVASALDAPIKELNCD